MHGSTTDGRRREAGTSLMELLVVMAVAGLVVGGAMSLLGGVQVSHHDVDRITNSRQAARVALAQLQTDVLIAGVGLTWMTANMPLIVLREDGGIDLRSNPGGLTTSLAENSGKGSILKVASIAGFSVGDEIVVHDNAGALEFHKIAKLKAAEIQLSRPLSGAFLVADGAAVVRIRTVSFYLAGDGDRRQLIREAERGPTTLAAGITELTFSYFDADGVQFVPNSQEDMLRIFAVGVAIESATDDRMLTGEASRRYRLTTVTSPRTLAMSNS